MRYRKYPRRKTDSDIVMEALLWLIQWDWRIGAALSLIGFAAFWYSLNGALEKIANPTGNPIIDLVPTSMPWILLAFPCALLLAALILGGISFWSWIKKQYPENHWY